MGEQIPASLWGYVSQLYLPPSQRILMCVRFHIFRHFLAGCLQIFCPSVTSTCLCTCENKEKIYLYLAFFFSVALKEITLVLFNSIHDAERTAFQDMSRILLKIHSFRLTSWRNSD